jgi:hypothetical protein
MVRTRTMPGRAIAASTLRPVLAIIALTLTAPVFALQPQTDNEVRQAIIQQSVSAYNTTGHPCACPYQSDRAGHSCGGRSAYSRPGGAAPLCYPADVTAGMVADWRRAHQ